MKHIRLPLTEADIAALQAGDEVLLSGPLYTARDAAHQRLCRCLQEGKPLPVELAGETIYYVGPSPAKPGEVIGSAGPTTSYRMDPYTPPLLALGLKGMIGKGRRSAEVVQAIREHGAVYFITIAALRALLAEAVKKKTPVCYEDLGPEAICRLEVENFYAIVGIDSRGNTIIRWKKAARRGGFFMPCGGTWHGSCYYNLTENRSIPDKTGGKHYAFSGNDRDRGHPYRRRTDPDHSQRHPQVGGKFCPGEAGLFQGTL